MSAPDDVCKGCEHYIDFQCDVVLTPSYLDDDDDDDVVNGIASILMIVWFAIVMYSLSQLYECIRWVVL